MHIIDIPSSESSFIFKRSLYNDIIMVMSMCIVHVHIIQSGIDAPDTIQLYHKFASFSFPYTQSQGKPPHKDCQHFWMYGMFNLITWNSLLLHLIPLLFPLLLPESFIGPPSCSSRFGGSILKLQSFVNTSCPYPKLGVAWG